MKNMLRDLILLASLEDNVYMVKKLETIEFLLKTEPNDSILGAKLREIL